MFLIVRCTMMKEIEKKKNNNNMSLESEGSNTLIDTMFRFKITHQTSKKKKKRW